MNSLREFTDMINEIDDVELIEVAEDLLRDMVTIEKLKEKIITLEDSLSSGKRAAFWFFAMSLDREQIDLATNTVIGRKRFLADKKSRAK